MSNFIFLDKQNKPDNKDLINTMGESYQLWQNIKSNISTDNSAAEEWKFYSRISGWTMKYIVKKRNLFFFTPLKDHFRLSFIFGDKAVEKILNSDLPSKIKEDLKSARKYAEGRGILLEVRDSSILPAIKKLIEIKMSN